MDAYGSRSYQRCLNYLPLSNNIELMSRSRPEVLRRVLPSLLPKEALGADGAGGMHEPGARSIRDQVHESDLWIDFVDTESISRPAH